MNTLKTLGQAVHVRFLRVLRFYMFYPEPTARPERGIVGHMTQFLDTVHSSVRATGDISRLEGHAGFGR